MLSIEENGYEVRFTAGIFGGTSTITATFPAACGLFGCPLTQEIAFNVIPPTNVTIERKDDLIASNGQPCGTHQHAANSVSIGIFADQYILPDNVNYYNISVIEGFAPLQTPTTPNYFTSAINAGFALNDHPAGMFIENTSDGAR